MPWWLSRTWSSWSMEQVRTSWQPTSLLLLWQLFHWEGKKPWHSSHSWQPLGAYLEWLSPRICLWARPGKRWGWTLATPRKVYRLGFSMINIMLQCPEFVMHWNRQERIFLMLYWQTIISLTWEINATRKSRVKIWSLMGCWGLVWETRLSSLASLLLWPQLRKLVVQDGQSQDGTPDIINVNWFSYYHYFFNDW